MFDSKKLCNIASETILRRSPTPPLRELIRTSSKTPQNPNNDNPHDDFTNNQTTEASFLSKPIAVRHDKSDYTTAPSTWRVFKEYSLRRKYTTLQPNESTKILTDEMRRFLDDYRRATPDVYWHRKSGQVVLAVLLVRIQGEYKCTRGINSELSLPSGTVCAERAAITAALSQYLEISRDDFLAMAVISPNQPNPIRPCGVCREWLSKIEEASPTFNVISFASTDLEEIVEYRSIPFVEEVLSHTPPYFKNPAWTCKCGYKGNSPKHTHCALCKQSRFKFRRQLQNRRVQVLWAILQLHSMLNGNSQETLQTEAFPVCESSHDTSEWEDECESSSDEEAAVNRSKSNQLNNKHTLFSSDASFVSKIAVLCNFSKEATCKTLRDLIALQLVSPKLLLPKHTEKDTSPISTPHASSSNLGVGPQLPHPNLLTKAGRQFLLSTPHSYRYLCVRNVHSNVQSTSSPLKLNTQLPCPNGPQRRTRSVSGSVAEHISGWVYTLADKVGLRCSGANARIHFRELPRVTSFS